MLGSQSWVPERKHAAWRNAENTQLISCGTPEPHLSTVKTFFQHGVTSVIGSNCWL